MLLNPALNNTSTNKATSEEISIIPIGGIIFLNGSKMVHNLPSISPNLDSNIRYPRCKEINNHSKVIYLN